MRALRATHFLAVVAWLVAVAPVATTVLRGEASSAPILVVTDPADPFSRYYAEILRAEGLNEFETMDLESVTTHNLERRAAVLLPPVALSDAQVSMLTKWVKAGGNLIAMRPDPKLAGLLGLGTVTGALSNGYVAVDIGSPPGAGITGATMQFHGEADVWTVKRAAAYARLSRDADGAPAGPAVTLNAVGPAGGQAAAFTFDLARSVVYTRQGNPAWAGQERDFARVALRRSDDLFYGAKPGDAQPDWVDLDKVRIPQADEQQRLLANLITEMSADRLPLPRFWYLPRGGKAAVVLTGDDHGVGGTAGQFDRYQAASPTGCSVEQWTCVRSTSYVYPDTPLTDRQMARYDALGFEIALHVSTGCADFTPVALAAAWTAQLRQFATKWPSLAPPRTSRTHCVAWSQWATQPKLELAHGVRLDTNYYYWPGSWVRNRPGMFTGSGFPMRFADLDGSTIDVYQAATQLTDESAIDIPLHIKTLLDGALGPQGFYGVFTANMHTDQSNHPGANAIVAQAQSRGVPVISARQLLEWLDGRNGSSFEALSFAEGRLHFTVTPAAGSDGLQAMIPVTGATGALLGLTRGTAAVATTTRVVKGVEYAAFDAAAGDYTATYATPSPRP